MPPPFKYHAFISYSHQDSRWGEWLHRALETYRIPPRLVGRETPAGVIPRRLAPIFRDRDELASAHDLGDKVGQALADSGALIVICSPNSAGSRWVNEEVVGFKRLGRADRVFCLIVDGEPNASDLPGHEADECFAPALRRQLDVHGQLGPQRAEPIAADARAGKDGKNGAKLKLVAGLLDVGLDELRQREQQRAHRRMAWVAGLALTGMLVTSSLAIVAIRARDQARFQREQAEGLIGFMLGNLRDKLNEVNRVDILDEVADQTMGYFDAQAGRLADSGGAKRAEALLLVGQVRLDQGRLDAAATAFEESLQTARMLAARHPGDPAAQMARADAHFYLGLNDWNRGDLDAALAHFRAALPIVSEVVAGNPGNEDWQERLRWSHNNVGHILEARGQLDAALGEYNAVLEIARAASQRHPEEVSYRQALADAHDALGQLSYSRGDLAGAERHYNEERKLLRAILDRNPKDNATRSQLAVAETFFAQVAESRGDADAARASLRRAHAIGEEMLKADPGNMSKTGDVASYCRRLARTLRLDGDLAAARVLLQRSAELYDTMLAESPDSVRARAGRAATMLEQARFARDGGDAARAGTLAEAAASAYDALLRQRSDNRLASLGKASAQLLIGGLAADTGHAVAATQAWRRALQALAPFGADSHDPDQLALRAEVLQRLGRDRESRAVTDRLAAMGYRDPEFVAWASRVHDRPLRSAVADGD